MSRCLEKHPVVEPEQNKLVLLKLTHRDLSRRADKFWLQTLSWHSSSTDPSKQLSENGANRVGKAIKRYHSSSRLQFPLPETSLRDGGRYKISKSRYHQAENESLQIKPYVWDEQTVRQQRRCSVSLCSTSANEKRWSRRIKRHKHLTRRLLQMSLNWVNWV